MSLLRPHCFYGPQFFVHENRNKEDAFMKKTCLPVYAVLLTANMAFAQSDDLLTQSETTLGVALNSYKYDEPSYMSLRAAMASFELSRTQSLGSQWPSTDQNWFVRGDLKYALGKADYSSVASGRLNNTPNWYMEARALVGKDFDMGNYVLAPYVGLGYRYLYNDLRTNDARQGYRRDSTYHFLPLGVTHTMKLPNRSNVLTTVEYLHLIKGVQKASLSDQNPVLENVRLLQPIQTLAQPDRIGRGCEPRSAEKP